MMILCVRDSEKVEKSLCFSFCARSKEEGNENVKCKRRMLSK